MTDLTEEDYQDFKSTIISIFESSDIKMYSSYGFDMNDEEDEKDANFYLTKFDIIGFTIKKEFIHQQMNVPPHCQLICCAPCCSSSTGCDQCIKFVLTIRRAV